MHGNADRIDNAGSSGDAVSQDQLPAVNSGQASAISIGGVLVNREAPHPTWFHFDLEEKGDRKFLRVSGVELERLAVLAGWSFACTAPGAGALHGAVLRILKSVSSAGFNSVEITGIAARQMLGVHHARVVAHPRHLRPNPFFRDPDPCSYPGGDVHPSNLLAGSRNRIPDLGYLRIVPTGQ
jgi:hypothetical protein